MTNQESLMVRSYQQTSHVEEQKGLGYDSGGAGGLVDRGGDDGFERDRCW